MRDRIDRNEQASSHITVAQDMVGRRERGDENTCIVWTVQLKNQTNSLELKQSFANFSAASPAGITSNHSCSALWLSAAKVTLAEGQVD